MRPCPYGTTGKCLYDDESWENTSEGAFSVYHYSDIEGLESEEDVLNAYGALYNWYAVEEGPQNICPQGFFPARDEDWVALSNYLGGFEVAGHKLRSTRTEPDGHPRWDSPNDGATDEIGFAALPGFLREDTGLMHSENIGNSAYFWTSTSSGDNTAYWNSLSGQIESVYRHDGYNKNWGMSVRCVMALPVF